MNDPAVRLLRSLYSAAILNSRNELQAEEVNDLGATLGLASETMLTLIEQLKAEHLVELYWGGKLSLTETGRDRAAGAPKAAKEGINLGAGAIYAPGNKGQVGHGIGAVASTVAVGGIAVGQALTAATGDLAALLQALRRLENAPDKNAASAARELGQEAQAAFDAIRHQTQAEPRNVKQHTERLRSLLARLGDAAVWGERGYAILELGRTVVEHLEKISRSL
jgi:hypothetical protein